MSNKENKTNDGFGSGIVMIIIGIIALMVTFFDVDIDWDILIKMWPILLIIIGICIMPINRWVRTAIALVLLALGFVAYEQKANDTESTEKTEITSSFKGDD